LILPKILFITCDRVKDSYGITSGLFNSANFVVKYLTCIGYTAKLTPVVDSNAIDQAVTEFDPDIVVIEALWVPPAKFDELLALARHKRRHWIVRIHSKAPFLANEGLATRWIQQYCSIGSDRLTIAPNTQELTDQLSAAIPHGKFRYLPNVYHIKEFSRESCRVSRSEINVGCFGAIRPMKNQYGQALAAIDFAERIGRRLRFHVNASRTEQAGDNALKNMLALFEGSRHELVLHPWYGHDEFLKVASTMDVGMQASFSESFNIVTADFVTAGVPILAADDIEWMPWISKVSPTAHRAIVNKLALLCVFPGIFKWAQSRALRVYNKRAQTTWLQVLQKLNSNK
jgi:hypothetical protein